MTTTPISHTWTCTRCALVSEIFRQPAFKDLCLDLLTGKRSNPRIREAIALAVGKPVTELWPEDQPKPEEKAA